GGRHADGRTRPRAGTPAGVARPREIRGFDLYPCEEVTTAPEPAMRLAAFAALTAALAAAPALGQPKDDKAAFQGTWKVTKIEYPADLGDEGKKLEEEM